MSNAEAVRSLIDARREGEAVNPATETLVNSKGSQVTVRPTGGVIESLTLVDSRGGRAKRSYELLYSDGDLISAKRSASHMMSPAGPFEGLGGQHGAGRWLDWHTFNLNPTDIGPQIAFQAKREDNGETLLRHIELGERQAWFETAVVAPYENDLRTSMGEHWYFKMDGDLSEVAIDGRNLELFTGDEEVYEKLRDGVPLHVPQRSPLNVWTLQLPGQPLLKMETQLFRSSGYVPTELWIWRRDGAEDYLCIEPVVGVSHENGYLENDLLVIEAGKEARLRTAIGLVV